jgi:Protein of unknown function (DUF3667)
METPFCGQCGQKASHRLDVKHIIHEFTHVMLHADKGIFGFVPKLMTSAGLIALDYVNGRRKKYFNPFQYLILVVGFNVFMITKLKYLERSTTMFTESKLTGRVAEFQHQMVEFMSHYYNFIIFLLIPIFAVMSFWLFRKKGYNYAEHVVLQCCIQGQQNTISLVLMLIAALLGNSEFFKVVAGISVVIVCITYAFGYKQFFKVSFGTALWKSILVYLMVQLVIMTIVIIAIAVFVATHSK